MGYEGATEVFVASKGRTLGAILLVDEVHPDSPRTLRLPRQAGIGRIVMLTGDRRDVAEAVSAAVGVDECGRSSSQGTSWRQSSGRGSRGCARWLADGVNDVLELAVADVGVAIGARGSGAAADAADVALKLDRLDRLAKAVTIAHGSRRGPEQDRDVDAGASVAARARRRPAASTCN